MVLSQMLISCSKNLEEIRNAKREFAKQIKCKEVKFSFHNKRLCKNRKIK